MSPELAPNLFAFLCLTLPLLLNGAPADHSELFLTPLIEAGELANARELSADHMSQFHIKSATNEKLKSYSGYLTIDKATNSNLFFWFFPALESPETAPVIMSLSEIAGFSCLKEVFLENGPFYVDENLELRDRKYSWVNKYSMLYIDAPVGSGFSFTKREEGYARNSDEDANEVIESLEQFFTLFDEFKDRDFYLSGKAVSAIHIPKMVKHIEANNKDSVKIKINLKGVILDSPWINTALHLSYADQWHAMGLIDERQRKEVEEAVKRIKAKMDEKKFTEAHVEHFKIILTQDGLYARMTGFKAQSNFLHANELPEVNNFMRFISEKEVHNYLHVGLHGFQMHNFNVHDRFRDEIMSADGKGLESIMGDYKILLIACQLESVHLHDGITRAVEALDWVGSNGGFKNTTRGIWRVNGDVAGYVRRTGRAVYALVRNTGRYIMQEQPEWCFQLVQNFIEDKEF